MFEYRASIVRIVDGDTVHADVDLGIDTHVFLTIRLAGINAPEMGTPEGPPAKEHLEGLIPVGISLTLHTIKDRREKYGRYLGTFIRDDGVDVNASMVGDGFAVVYP